jgi:plasmid rolling circle replication initiator protein Rep
MQNYKDGKLRSQGLQKIVGDFAPAKTFDRFCECGSYINVIADYDVKTRKVQSANFCKWAFCPLCEMRKARRDSMKLAVLLAYIAEVHKKEFIFLTLTAPNVRAENLAEEITRFNLAFKKLTKRKELAGLKYGYVRKLEVTYNKKRDDFHPHFHVIFAVNKSYFTSRDYIKQEKWLDLWRDCMGDDSITQVDVRKVQRRADAETLAEGYDMREMAKYAAKDSDYAQSSDVFADFYFALRGRQKLTYAGLFKDANALFKEDKLEDYIKPDKTLYYWEIAYIWASKDYAEKKRRALDETDKLFLARRGIDTELCE